MDFQQILEMVGQKQFERFNGQISGLKEIDRQTYVFIFLSTFLLGLKCKTKNFDERCHHVIDNTSLCKQETEFFHFVVNTRSSGDKFIDLLIEEYHKTKDLSGCQLGPNVLRCLEASRHLNIVE